MPALRRLRQENLRFETNQSSIANFSTVWLHSRDLSQNTKRGDFDLCHPIANFRVSTNCMHGYIQGSDEVGLASFFQFSPPSCYSFMEASGISQSQFQTLHPLKFKSREGRAFIPQEVNRTVGTLRPGKQTFLLCSSWGLGGDRNISLRNGEQLKFSGRCL